MAKTVTAAGTGSFLTVEESSLKPWRVAKVAPAQYTLSLMNSQIRCFTHTEKYDVAGIRGKKFKCMCLAVCSAVFSSLEYADDVMLYLNSLKLI